MIRRNAGFTIIELLISVAIVGFVLAAAATFFILSVKQYKIQTKITETNVEGVLGLELLRRDLESAGFGLPWSNLSAYTETTAGPLNPLNDSPNAPRAVVSIDCAANTVNKSDYLAIKSTSVGMDEGAGKWTTLNPAGGTRNWNPAVENISGTDFVIVLSLGNTDANRRALVNPGTYFLQFGGLPGAADYRPLDPFPSNLVYAIGSAQPRRPFNRADYFIADESTNPSITVPQRCAPNTGVLVKAVVPHTDSGNFTALLPLLDCAADMQVVFGLDNNADGIVNVWTRDLPSGANAAATIRAQLREIHVSVLAHEGQRDDGYTYQSDNILVATNVGLGNSFNIGALKNYRWKVYRLVIRTWNLAQ